jgi:N-acetyl sugar amidotransferase
MFLKRCSFCVMPITRPRIIFDKKGICNACNWSFKKKNINWKVRENKLKEILIKHKKKSESEYDCITTVSGGKDGSYVAYNLKKKYGLKQLCVTVRPPLETEIGIKNVKNFISSGYEHIHISPNEEQMRVMNLFGLVQAGFPYWGWLVAIHTAVFNLALKLKINLIFYSEDGEIEYGGDTTFEKKYLYGVDYIKSRYLENNFEKILNNVEKKIKLSKFHFIFDKSQFSKNINFTHYSYYDNWDPYKNYLIAKKYCGLKENHENSLGGFTNFSQIDQKLYPLHIYLKFLKFGFGRATDDASIDIRRGALKRDQGIQLVQLYDNFILSDTDINIFSEYYKIKRSKLFLIFDKWANKNLFTKVKGIWKPRFVNI